MREAARFIPLERLALSPQCGFATSILGNALSLEDERAKLRAVAETAERVWGKRDGRPQRLRASRSRGSCRRRPRRRGGRARAGGRRADARDARGRRARARAGRRRLRDDHGRRRAQDDSRAAARRSTAFNRALVVNHLVGARARTRPTRSFARRCCESRTASPRGTRGRPAAARGAARRGAELGRAARVRLLGSLGQSDLAPLADLAHGLFGDVELQAKEGLALLNIERVLDRARGSRRGATRSGSSTRSTSPARSTSRRSPRTSRSSTRPSEPRVRTRAFVSALARLRGCSTAATSGSGDRAEPAGSAHLPLPAADARRRSRRARLRPSARSRSS